MKAFRFPPSSAHLAAWIGIHSLICILRSPSLLAQPSSQPLTHFWQTDDTVHAIVLTNGTAYLGGEFSYVGPANGAAGLATLTTGLPIFGFPKLAGTVKAVVDDGGGGWFVGGAFATEERPILHHLVHVLPNGRLDRTFLPSPNSTVNALARAGTALWVGGQFTEVGGVNTGNLGVLDSTTGKTNGLRLHILGAVNALVVQGDLIYIGGEFSSVTSYRGTQPVSNPRRRVAVARHETAEVLPWNPGCTGGNGINAIAVNDETVFLGGDFTQCAGKPRASLASVSATDGSVDNWNPNPQSPGAARPVIYALAAVGDILYVGGEFTSIGARARARLAALQASGFGQAIADWQADANGSLECIVPIGADLLVGGAFTKVGGTLAAGVHSGGTPRPGFARIAQADGTAASWGPRVSLLRPPQQGTPTTYAVAAQGDTVLLGGNYLSFGGNDRAGLAAISLETGAATAWNPGAEQAVRVLALAEDALLVGGAFTNVGGARRPRLAKVDLTTGQATSWDPRFEAGQFVNAMAVGPNSLYVGGAFQRIGGQARPNLAELSSSTGDATEWNPQPNGTVFALVVDQDSIYAGGAFQSVSGAAQKFLALLTTNTAASKQLVKTFDARLDAQVRCLGLSADRSTLYVGGDFSRVGTQGRKTLAALDASTGQETVPWDAQIAGSGQLHIRTVLPLGQAIYVGGQFRAAGGENRARISSVHSVFGVASGWDPGADAPINALARDSTLLLIGGEFTRLGLHGANPNPATDGQPVTHLAAFNALPKFELCERTSSGICRFAITDGDGLGGSLCLQVTPSLSNPTWTTVKTVDVLGLQDPVEDTPPAGVTRFYRLLRQP